MSNILNIRKTAVADDRITRKQFHNYAPYTTTFNNSDEIRITIQQQDLYVLPHESYLYVEFSVARKGTNAGELPKFVNNYGAFLFEELRYELNGFEIDRCKHAGISSCLKGYATFSRHQHADTSHTTWNLKAEQPAAQLTTNYSFCLPLKYLFGFCEDYKRILMNCKHELIIIRGRTDMPCFIGNTEDIAEFYIKKIHWRVPHIQVNEESKLKLLKLVENKHPIELAFRSWELYEFPGLPQSDKHIWQVKTTNTLNKPRYIIVTLQIDRSKITADMSGFDHCNMRDIKVYLNSESFPYDEWQLNFESDSYVEAYHAYANFVNDYYGEPIACRTPFLTYSEFKNRPIFVFDCSRQNESLKTSMIDCRVEFKSTKNIPANTTAYCLIVHDNLITYNPYTSIVSRSI